MQNYIPLTHYSDIYDVEIIDPTCCIRNFLLFYDNHEEFDPLNTLVTLPKNKQFHMILLFVQNGEVELEINSKQVKITSSQMLMVYPESTIRYVNYTDDTRYFMIVIYPRLLGLTFEDLGNTFNVARHTQRFETMTIDNDAMNYCLSIYNEMKKDTCRPPYEFKFNCLRSYLNILLVEVTNLFGVKPEKINGVSNSRQYDVFTKFLNALNKHGNTERSVQYFAELLDISPKYLSFVCISYSNKNASSWIDEFVISRANNLMTVHQYSLSETSDALSFQSVSSFCRFYKRVTGMTPKEFLNSQKH